MTEKYPGHYETVKCFELVNNYNCSKKHKCLKKILDETKIYDIIINGGFVWVESLEKRCFL